MGFKTTNLVNFRPFQANANLADSCTLHCIDRGSSFFKTSEKVNLRCWFPKNLNRDSTDWSAICVPRKPEKSSPDCSNVCKTNWQTSLLWRWQLLMLLWKAPICSFTYTHLTNVCCNLYTCIFDKKLSCTNTFWALHVYAICKCIGRKFVLVADKYIFPGERVHFADV